MAQLKPAAKILIGIAIIAPLGYFGSQYLDKVPAAAPATEQAQPQEVTVTVTQPQVPQQAVIEQQPEPVAEVQAAPQPQPEPAAQTSDAGLGALLNAGKK